MQCWIKKTNRSSHIDHMNSALHVYMLLYTEKTGANSAVANGLSYLGVDSVIFFLILTNHYTIYEDFTESHYCCFVF